MTFRYYSTRCGMRACFLGWGLVLNARLFCHYGVRCGMRACFLGVGLGVECVRDF